MLGKFSQNPQGLKGSLLQMVNHGLTTSALFQLVGMLYERRHTYELTDYKGLWKAIPVFGGLFVIAAFASIGLPGFSGFVGEFLSLLGAFLTSRWYVVIATTGVILAATLSVIEQLVLAGYGTLAAQGARLAGRERWTLVTEKTSGALMIGAGLGLATLRRN
jgi:NADH:ubiquinone oxidoreductase subunit 4 (subunit M)